MTPQCPSTHTALRIHTHIHTNICVLGCIIDIDNRRNGHFHFICSPHCQYTFMSNFYCFYHGRGCVCSSLCRKRLSLSNVQWMCAFVRLDYPRSPFSCVWLFIPFTIYRCARVCLEAYQHIPIHTYKEKQIVWYWKLY